MGFNGDYCTQQWRMVIDVLTLKHDHIKFDWLMVIDGILDTLYVD